MSHSANVKVSVRVRPTANFAQDQLRIDQDTNSIFVNLSTGHGEDDHDSHYSANKADSFNFSYHHVLHNAGQESVYESNTSKVVDGVMNGRNGTVFAYGQTGAGKTFTMLGSLGTYHQRGIQPRAISHIFSQIEARTEYDFKVSVSYMELYNERIFDLLSIDQKDQSSYQIVEDKRRGKGTHVRGLITRECTSEKEALNCLFEGAERRTTAQHVLNTSSNRSHCIFTIYITQRSRLASSDKVVHSKLNLVDLAGSERLKKVDREDPVTGERTLDSTIRRESMYINKSLTYLEQCVVALTTKGRSHIPYRQTKLTNVLKDSLGGNSNTLMVACVYGEAAHMEETLSTLRLAQRMMKVENKSEEVITIDPVRRIKQLEMTVKSLKQELMMHDALAERSGVTYDEYTPEQRHEVATMVRTYLDAPPETEEGVIQIQSIRHVVEIFRAFKLIVKNVESQTMEKLRNQFNLSAKGDTGTGTVQDLGGGSSVGDGGEDEGGEIEGGGGYAVGVAPQQARPDRIDMGDSPMKGDRSPLNSPNNSPSKSKVSTSNIKKAFQFDDKNSAFNIYKSKDGAALNEDLMKTKTKLVQLKAKARVVRTNLNDLKTVIDSLKASIASKRASYRAIDASKQNDEEDVVDEEEFRMMKEEQTAKRDYRKNFNVLKSLRVDIEQLTRTVQSKRAELVSNFDAWYATATGEDLNEVSKSDDRMDEGEMFEKMEIDRVMDEDPESVAFFLAQKNLDKARRKDHGKTARNIRSKRLHK
jgi:kinesin family member 6/9